MAARYYAVLDATEHAPVEVLCGPYSRFDSAAGHGRLILKNARRLNQITALQLSIYPSGKLKEISLTEDEAQAQIKARKAK